MLVFVKYLSLGVAIWFLFIVPSWYLGHYLLEQQNSYHGEYLQGATISLVLMVPVAVLVFLVSRSILRKREL